MKITHVPFSLGSVYITPNAQDALSPDAINQALNRHHGCDWGACYRTDWLLNDKAVQEGDRLFSVYYYDGQKFWIITEADRSSTTILLPEDY